MRHPMNRDFSVSRLSSPDRRNVRKTCSDRIWAAQKISVCIEVTNGLHVAMPKQSPDANAVALAIEL